MKSEKKYQILHEEGQESGWDHGLGPEIIRFSDLLRSRDIPVPFSSVMESLQSLSLIDISDIRIFYETLRCHLVLRKEHHAVFDELFREFWLNQYPEMQTCEARRSTVESDEHDPQTDEPEIRLSYSPHQIDGTRSLDALSFEESRELYQSMEKILARLARSLSRRYRYSPRGKTVSLKRIFRRNMQFGGEPLMLDFKQKKLKKKRILFFCDVSGSMNIHTLMILQFIHALRRIDPRTEIFLFSTDLTRGTLLFRAEDFSRAFQRLPYFVTDWKGGTRIGHSLRTFNEQYAHIRVSSGTIVMIFSDGWDRGDIGLLRNQMAVLKRKAYKMIWLNPLLGTRGYQPICRGMSAALPFLDYFLPARRMEDIQLIADTLGRMMVR